MRLSKGHRALQGARPGNRLESRGLTTLFIALFSNDGIVSERDVVRAMPGKLDELAEMHVKDLMTSDVITCSPNSTVAELMTVMTERRIRHVPVVDETGNLLSIVSIGDVVKAHINDLDAERKALSDYVNS